MDLSDIGYEDELNRLCMELALKTQRVKVMTTRIEEIQNLLRDFNRDFNGDKRTQKGKKMFGKYGYYIGEDRHTLKVDADKLTEFCEKNKIDLGQFLSEVVDKDKVKKFFENDEDGYKEVTNDTLSKGVIKTIG